MFRFHAMLIKGDESCYDFSVLFVLIFLTHSTSLLFLFLNYFLQQYIWKQNPKYLEEKSNSKKKNGYHKIEKYE
jgi:hypothetical protein